MADAQPDAPRADAGRDWFERLAAPPRHLAAIYFYSTLDELVDLARTISCDFLARPQLYTEIGGVEDGSVAAVLSRLHFRYGCDESTPSHDQRARIYDALFAGTGEDFARLRDAILAASAAFAERVFNEGVEMLRERVRTAHRPFKEFLLGLDGEASRWARYRVLDPITEPAAYAVLRSRGVAAVFGIATPPGQGWPYELDSNGDKLVEQVSVQLAALREGAPPITRATISAKQRAAMRGAEAIAAVLDFDESQPDDRLDELIARCYTWGSALEAASQPLPGRERFDTTARAGLGRVPTYPVVS